jgi:farnesyl diphosphate synthase
MVGGQAIDLDAVGQTLDLVGLENMHIRKTGALIRASVRMACLTAADLPHPISERLDHYAKCIGLAFQIKDDILDEESDTQTLGKTQGKDKQHNKPNYPSLLGLGGARDKAQELYREALDSLAPLGDRAGLLSDLAQFIVQRHS